MEGVFEKFNIELNQEISKGVAKISTFEFKNENNPLYNMRIMMDGGRMFRVLDGKYVRLFVDKELMMSDTNMERISNEEFVRKANGRVFIAGLGIGMIIHALKEKVDNGEVTELVVMEKYQDVIDLVSPYLEGIPVKIVCDDILTYKPTKEDVFDTIYFDIWATIDEENLSEIRMLHNRWKNKKNKSNPDCWMDSWMKEYLQQQKRRSYY